jgi:phosphoglycerol transferase
MKKRRGLIYFIGFCLLGIVAWTKKYMVPIATTDEVLSTLVLGSQNLFEVDFHLIRSVLIYGLILPVLLTLLVLKIEQKIHTTGRRRFVTNLTRFFPLLLVVFSLFALTKQFNLKDGLNYYITKSGKDDFARLYHDPVKVKFKATAPQSLIWIYVESLETTYSNKKIFGRDLLAQLNALKIGQISFSQFEQVTGTEWTIASLVASQCGIPLKLVSVFDTNRRFELIKQFLPRATCLSDILASQGYTNVFLKGGTLGFAGFNKFLQTHHYQEKHGKNEWLQDGIKKNQLIGWGLPDDLLFEKAKKTLAKLMHRQKPFNLTIFTVDTHGVDGQLNESCRGSRGKSFADIVECTANQVADFVGYIKKQGWSDNLTIVIMGDHLAMQNAVSDKLLSSPQRYIFNLILSSKSLPKNTDRLVHFDLFPTVLHALGFSFPGNKLALGHSVLGEQNSETDDTRLAQLRNILSQRSKTYEKLWGFS